MLLKYSLAYVNGVTVCVFDGWGNNEVIQFIGISEYVSYGVKTYYVIM